LPPTSPPKPSPKPRKIHPTLERAIGAAKFGQAKKLELPEDQLVTVGQWDYHDGAGKVVATVVRFNLPSTTAGAKPPKVFVPLHRSGEGWSIGDPPRWPLYHLPDVMAAVTAKQRVYITEGEKAAEAVRKLGLACTTTAHGAKSPRATDFAPLAGVDEVVCFPDNDDAGREYMKAVASIILDTSPLARVRIVDLAKFAGLPPKADFVEYLHDRTDNPGYPSQGDIITELEGVIADRRYILLDAAPETRPEIRLSTDEFRVIEEAEAALAKDPDVFQRGGMLVRVTREKTPQDGISRPDGAAVISALPAPNLRERLTRFARFIRTGKDDHVPTHPPTYLPKAIEFRGEWPSIRPLQGISDAPVVRADGTVWQKAGYDARTQVLYEPARGAAFPLLPERLTRKHATAAVEILNEVICDFRFESEPHRSGWFAGLLTPLARFAFEGPSPLFLADANVKGAGKGLMVQTFGHIVLGDAIPVSSYSHESNELRKAITAIAIAGDRMVLFDNLEGPFGNGALDRALTCTRWKDRVLGLNKIVDLPLIPAWYATGNNVQVAADTIRRIVHIRLDVLEEHPETRTDFKHPDLVGWIKENRGPLLLAAITIIAAYLQAGRPQPPKKLTPFGSFEGWSGVVRHALVWLGLPDPCLSREALEASADTCSDTLHELMLAWSQYSPGGGPLVVKDVLCELYDRGYQSKDSRSSNLRSAIESFVEIGQGKVPSARQFGNKMRAVKRRVTHGMFFDSDPETKSKSGNKWYLHQKHATHKQTSPVTLVTLFPTQRKICEEEEEGAVAHVQGISNGHATESPEAGESPVYAGGSSAAEEVF
jgi:hypothetical protein